jgi:hypothetical protein
MGRKREMWDFRIAKSGTKIIMENSVQSILIDCKYKFNSNEGTHEL